MIEQIEEGLSWSEVKALLERLQGAGLLTLTEATKNRLTIQWEPRVFPKQGIKPYAQQNLEVVTHDLTLAFNDQLEREEFARWLATSGLLTE